MERVGLYSWIGGHLHTFVKDWGLSVYWGKIWGWCLCGFYLMVGRILGWSWIKVCGILSLDFHLCRLGFKLRIGIMGLSWFLMIFGSGLSLREWAGMWVQSELSVCYFWLGLISDWAWVLVSEGFGLRWLAGSHGLFLGFSGFLWVVEGVIFGL